jgi:predicted PurR-regulated permease PerM
MNGSSDIIIKLFDTLKDSTDKNERTMQTLINQQQVLVENVTHLPIDEIKQDIKDHIVSAREERKVISDKVDTISSKVTKMILVVVAAFSLFTVAYFVVRSTSDIDKIKKEITREQEIKHDEIIETIRKEFQKHEKKQ